MELMIFGCSMQTINDFCVSFSLGTNIIVAFLEVSALRSHIPFQVMVAIAACPPLRLLYRSSCGVLMANVWQITIKKLAGRPVDFGKRVVWRDLSEETKGCKKA